MGVRSGAACGASWTWTRANVTTPLYHAFSPPTDTGIDFSPDSVVIGYGDSLMEGISPDENQKRSIYTVQT
jgi:hypothetical protein